MTPDELMEVIKICSGWGFGLGFLAFLTGHSISVLLAFFKGI